MELPNREALITAAEQYIDSIHSTLYGQAWDVTQPNRRREAAEWLVDEIAAIVGRATLNHYQSNNLTVD